MSAPGDVMHGDPAASRGGVALAVLGADGSGKSSVVGGVAETLAPRFRGVTRLHFRPFLAEHNARPPVADPHGEPSRGTLPSIVKLAYYLLDCTVGYAWVVAPRLARGELVLFDRYYHDLLVDPGRYRYGGPATLARLGARLVPLPGVLVLLDAPPEVLQARKHEVPLADTVRAREGYLQLFRGLPSGHVVSASRPLPEVVAEVSALVLRHAGVAAGASHAAGGL